MKSALTDTRWSPAGWALAAVATVGLLTAALLPPFLGPDVEAVVTGAFRSLCHQIPGRSFAIDGTPLAVCHRCIGIYLGLAVGVLLFPFIRKESAKTVRYDRWVLGVAVLPATLDWGGDVLGVIETARRPVTTASPSSPARVSVRVCMPPTSEVR